MKIFLIVVLSLIIGMFVDIGVFALTTKIASLINGVSFYGQLRLWFGSGSAFAKLFI